MSGRMDMNDACDAVFAERTPAYMILDPSLRYRGEPPCSCQGSEHDECAEEGE